MERKINLHLNMYPFPYHSFGSTRLLSCQPSFKIEALEDFCTISSAIYAERDIFAKVVQLKRPFSELKEMIVAAS